MARRTNGGTAWSVDGDGPVVALIHGLGLNRRMWQWQVDSLCCQFRVIRYDLLGHGDTLPAPGDFTMKAMVDQLVELLDTCDAKSCSLVGFSLGGLIAQAFTLSHPDRVEALVILNSAHNRSDEQRAAIMQRVGQAEKEGPAATPQLQSSPFD